MIPFARCLLVAILLCSTLHAVEPPDPTRVETVAAMLADQPQGVGRPIGDRVAWEKLARAEAFSTVIADAEELLDEPMPDWSDDLYLEFSQNGNRSNFQSLRSKRHGRLGTFVLAECFENRGRFLPAIEATIVQLCDEPSWVLPAHDRSLSTFDGSETIVDLSSSATSWQLATVVYWLGDKLSPQSRSLIAENLEERIFKPYELMIATGKPRLWWVTGTNNWNSVCLAGVTGAALGAIESKERRAFYVAAAEKYVDYFLQGFTPDGYCSEGLSYWNYGFGHYVLLAETLHQATDGQIDLMSPPQIETIGRFGRGMEILPGIYPALADCRVGSRPDPVLSAYLSRRFGWGLAEVESAGLLEAAGPGRALFTVGIFAMPNSATAREAVENARIALPPRDWYPDAGILIARPAGNGLGAAIKGGHNAEHHNHNDVGSFVVAIAGGTPLVDPGSEVYTRRTFSSQRYDSGVLNSLGHPVPRIGGKLQRTGRSAAGKLLDSNFTDDVDTLQFDLSAAYAVPGLERLVRTFVFSRVGRGSLTVTDEVTFESPQTFETALITFSSWEKRDDGELVFGEDDQAVSVTIDTGGNNYTITSEKIEEDLGSRGHPTRVAITLTEPVKTAVVRMVIEP